MSKQIDQMMDEIKGLKGHVLSVYLNTNPDSEDWKILLKNGLKRTTEYIQASNPEQIKEFQKICKQVDQTIKDNQTSFLNSLACFASSEQLYIYHLQIPVQNDFTWKEVPEIKQLEELIEQFSKNGVILLQRDKVTMISSLLGEMLDEVHYEFDLETEDWKQYKGMGFGSIYASSANHRDKYDRRLKVNQARWYKKIAPTIEKFARKHNWNGAHLAGPAELTKKMQNNLNLNIIGETTRNYSGKSAHAILEKTLLAED